MFWNESFQKRSLSDRRVLLSSFFLFCLILFPVSGFSDEPETSAQPSAASPASQTQQASASQEGSLSKSDRVLEGILVTESRLPGFKVPFADVPANVSIKTKDEIRLTRPNSIQEVLKDSEGLFFYDQVGNGLDQSLGIRGFAQSRYAVWLVDGVRVNEVDGNDVSYPLIATDDLHSVQVDRGAASPVYGGNAFAGVINITTGRASSKPVSNFGGLDWSSFHGLHFYEGISGTLNDQITPLDGKWSYYFRGGRKVNDQDGFRANGEYRITSFDFKTGYELPDDQARLDFGLKHVDDAVSNPGEMTFQQYQDDPTRTNKPLDGRKYKSTIGHLSGYAKFFDYRLTVSFLSSQRYNQIHAYTTSTQFADGAFDPDTNFFTTESRDFNHVIQLQYNDTFGWLTNRSIAGVEFRRGTNTQTQRDAFGGFIRDDLAAERDRVGQVKNFAIFWNESIELFDQFIPFIGMRHDYNWLKSEDVIGTNDYQSRWRESTISAGFTFHPIPFVDLFANYSEAFRIPTLDDLAFTDAPLDPEKANSYEAGFRVRVTDISETKLSYFLTDVEDEIVFDSNAITSANPFGQNTNIGKSRRYGIELRQELKPIKEVKLYGAYTWTRAYIRETNTDPFGAPLIDGRSLGQVPENRFILGVVIHPLLKMGEPYEGFRIGLNGTFTGRQHPDSFQSASQAYLDANGGAGHYIKPYSVWNMILAFEWKSKEFFFKINNLFNEKYYSRAVNSEIFDNLGGPRAATAVYQPGIYTFVVPGAPREFIFGMRYEFDTLGDSIRRLFTSKNT